MNVKFLHDLFPNAKFVYIIRDGRDAAYSYLIREKEGKNVSKSIRDYLIIWNMLNEFAYRDCEQIGKHYCHKIYYEQLVTNPEPHLRELIRFLGLNWISEILHHDVHIRESKILISNGPLFKKFPRGQISNSSIGKWNGKVLEFEDRTFLDKYAPMLKKLNYI